MWASVKTLVIESIGCDRKINLFSRSNKLQRKKTPILYIFVCIIHRFFVIQNCDVFLTKIVHAHVKASKPPFCKFCVLLSMVFCDLEVWSVFGWNSSWMFISTGKSIIFKFKQTPKHVTLILPIFVWYSPCIFYDPKLLRVYHQKN